ncbi:metal-dependent hydrolase [Halodesulfurarchaeum formicicum]|uniref:Membrane-bound metal-dependent hydrolase n=1 Tax=Halodesulfurarchaeum formicicum TaxID=1873524 RepID=A0A1J1AAJ5_9EURY|nr:metal-dependent hydrolase [Halodesulfurarchaeum formicicum]APE94816.1 hypothetical protein HSR6_0350 [Halodesulfurarchaeum formicicum]
MFVGHEFLALAAGIALARAAGLRADSALAVGLVAGVSAALPDLDVLVAVVGAAGALAELSVAGWEQFWVASEGIHRGVTHTLIAGGSAAVVLAASAVGQRAARQGRRGELAGAIAVGVGTVVAVLAFLGPAVPRTGWLGYSLMLLGAIVVGGVVGSRTILGWRPVLGASLLGLLSHPFGDVFMASPPQACYPLGPFMTAPIRLAADPTLNLLRIALVELGAVWIGLFAVTRVRDLNIVRAIDRLALAGLTFPLFMTLLPTPTMAAAHWLGFPLVPFALLGLAPLRDSERPAEERIYRSIATGTATLTLGLLAYGLLLLAPGLA